MRLITRDYGIKCMLSLVPRPPHPSVSHVSTASDKRWGEKGMRLVHAHACMVATVNFCIVIHFHRPTD